MTGGIPIYTETPTYFMYVSSSCNSGEHGWTAATEAVELSHGCAMIRSHEIYSPKLFVLRPVLRNLHFYVILKNSFFSQRESKYLTFSKKLESQVSKKTIHLLYKQCWTICSSISHTLLQEWDCPIANGCITRGYWQGTWLHDLQISVGDLYHDWYPPKENGMMLNLGHLNLQSG